MSNRFAKLTKIPNEPAARMLANADTVLKTKIEAPVSALPEAVLAELAEKNATNDVLRLLSVALPARERVWWACLAARDLPEVDNENPPAPLAASEAWVFDPSEENRIAAQASLDHAHVDDETVLCATSVLYCDGTLGPGELKEYPAPAGAAEVVAFAMNIMALKAHSDKIDEYGQLLIDRALDIARGGSGRMETRDGQNEKMEEGT